MKRIATIACCLLMMSGAACAQTKVIAHRGHWNSDGASMNSVAALKNAYKAGAFGSEFDVHITKDGTVVVNHDDDIQGVIIEDANYAEIRGMKLSNGEFLPTLRQYLEAGKKLGDMRLVLEIKAHATPEKEDRCVKECVKQVKEFDLQQRVDYISFSMHACEQVLKEDPTTEVYYLGSDVAPDAIKAKGLAGIDYHGMAILKHPEWVEQSHKLGMKVNVWTIDEMKQIQQCVNANVDFITTNKPEEAIKIAEGKLKF